MEGKRFSINGIKVTATHLGGGLYVGIPDNLGEALKALKTLLSGALFEPRDIQLLPDEPKGTPQGHYTAPKAPAAPKPDFSNETVLEHCKRKGYSQRDFADLIGKHHKTVWRWQQEGKKMSEV
jgi:hypothetical protein